MSLLSRHIRLLAPTLVLLALSALPISGPSPTEHRWLSATPAWAGGSPDETLNPQTPPRARGAYLGMEKDGGGAGAAASLRTTRPTSVLSWKERIGIAFRIYLASKLRF